jgi:hypothetical protein
MFGKGAAGLEKRFGTRLGKGQATRDWKSQYKGGALG